MPLAALQCARRVAEGAHAGLQLAGPVETMSDGLAVDGAPPARGPFIPSTPPSTSIHPSTACGRQEKEHNEQVANGETPREQLLSPLREVVLLGASPHSRAPELCPQATDNMLVPVLGEVGFNEQPQVNGLHRQSGFRGGAGGGLVVQAAGTTNTQPASRGRKGGGGGAIDVSSMKTKMDPDIP